MFPFCKKAWIHKVDMLGCFADTSLNQPVYGLNGYFACTINSSKSSWCMSERYCVLPILIQQCKPKLHLWLKNNLALVKDWIRYWEMKVHLREHRDKENLLCVCCTGLGISVLHYQPGLHVRVSVTLLFADLKYWDIQIQKNHCILMKFSLTFP